jgi:hypothetical protein
LFPSLGHDDSAAALEACAAAVSVVFVERQGRLSKATRRLRGVIS